MQLKPNQTVLEGLVREVRPQPDGWGAELDLDVLDNVSPSADGDFLQPSAGERVTVFWGDSEPLRIGARVRAQLTLHGGPTGGRAVVQRIEPLD